MYGEDLETIITEQSFAYKTIPVSSLKKILFVLSSILLTLSCNPKEDTPDYGTLQLVKSHIGDITLSTSETTENVENNSPIQITFSSAVDTNTVSQNILLRDSSNQAVNLNFSFDNSANEIIASPDMELSYNAKYTLQITASLKGKNQESFPGITYLFQTINGKLKVIQITLNNADFSINNNPQNISLENSSFSIDFNFPLNPDTYQKSFVLIGFDHLTTTISNNNLTVNVAINSPLNSLQKYFFTISAGLTSIEGYPFAGFSNYFYSAIDSTPKLPIISDEELLTKVQEQTFKYYWDYAHPSCGLSRERLGSGDIVTTGGSGFGLMALIVGVEREFITRTQFIDRMQTVVNFLETSDRFHGAWPHWINGSTGKVYPFSTNDDGADLVETSFLIQGLITVRQYLNANIAVELDLINRINQLWANVEWDWFTRDQNVLYWHWSPNNDWIMNMPIHGYNEAMITYILAASSTAHTITPEVFHEGFMLNGGVINGNNYLGYTLPLGYSYGGPLFFAHYSFLGLDPRNLVDQYASYWEQNKNHTLINQAYCISNPKNYLLYSNNCYGLTASDNQNGYSAHSPTNDLGVITPTAALSSFPYTPEESMDALKFFYYTLGDKLWGNYGFYDAFNPTAGWWASSYISIDQGPIICMIENYRTGLLWDLFMSAPEVQTGLTKLGFTY